MNDLLYKSFMTVVLSTWNHVVRKPYHVAAFMAVWYYIELLYMMNIAIFFYPPMLISLIGIILGIALSIHILKLYIGNTINVTIHVFVMDVHIAYSAGLTIAAVLSGATWYAVLIVIVRDIIAVIELLLVYTMTKEE
ncbi:MAG TPA: hypothetical protein PLO73_10455 [Spirochaetota bacterium]|nr:hypothetical protein [Spirochaetota bacterium]HPP50385.1 hypothetical protein [Spirochaetota bacterium]